MLAVLHCIMLPIGKFAVHGVCYVPEPGGGDQYSVTSIRRMIEQIASRSAQNDRKPTPRVDVCRVIRAHADS